MANNLENQRIQAKSFWGSITDTNVSTPCQIDEETRKLLSLAESKLEHATITSAHGTEHNGLAYAMFMYVAADNLVNSQHNHNISQMLIKTSVMVAMEECGCYKGNWSYGSRMLFDLRKTGIKVERPVVAAFLAQEGTWDTNRSKGDLLDGNIIAVGIYCARLKTLCYTLDNIQTHCGGTEEVLEQIDVAEKMQSLQEIFGFYLRTFAVPYLVAKGSTNANAQIDAFLDYLEKHSDFYMAPCSTKYHLNRDGGLAEHEFHVLMKTLWLTLPATTQQLGACILAALGHDLCKCNVYKKEYKTTKTYLTAGEEAPADAYVKEDRGGRFYWADDFFYRFNDAMPFGHGRKSAYILMSFFPEIGEEVFAAVDGHMGDPTVNANWLQQLAENPLIMNLHIADILATYIDEHQ